MDINNGGDGGNIIQMGSMSGEYIHCAVQEIVRSWFLFLSSLSCIFSINVRGTKIDISFCFLI